MISRLQLGFLGVKPKIIQLWMTIAVLVLAPLLFGSVDLFWIAVWTILLSVSALLGASTILETDQRRLFFLFLALCCLYALISIVQITPNAIGSLDDPIWAGASRVLGIDLLPRMSSRAAIPAVAIGHFLLFATSFVSGFYVGTSLRNGDKLIRYARYSILFYAIYGLAALVLTPNMLLWADKVAYQGSLTATFVNHNTAATFFGAGVILWLCETLAGLQSARLSTLRSFLIVRSNEALAFKIVLQSGATLLCLFALLRTGSRGGLICSAIGVLVAVTLMVVNNWKLRRRYAVAFVLLTGFLTLRLVFGMTRIASQGLIDDNRLAVYALSWQSIKERPILGAGIGTFPDLFPAFRSNDLWTWGVWDYAHSTILEIAFEMGIPLALLVMIAAISSVFILIRAAAKSELKDRVIIGAIAGIAFLTFSHSLIDFSLQIPGYLIVFSILLGCGLARALSSKIRKRASESSPGRNHLGSGQKPVLV
jgi:O-antigen ligase